MLNTLSIADYLSTFLGTTFVAPSGGSPLIIVGASLKFRLAQEIHHLIRSQLTSTNWTRLASYWTYALSCHGDSPHQGKVIAVVLVAIVFPVVVQVRVAVFPVVTHAENLQESDLWSVIHYLIYCTSNLATCGYAPCMLSVKDSYSEVHYLCKSICMQ